MRITGMLARDASIAAPGRAASIGGVTPTLVALRARRPRRSYRGDCDTAMFGPGGVGMSTPEKGLRRMTMQEVDSAAGVLPRSGMTKLIVDAMTTTRSNIDRAV